MQRPAQGHSGRLDDCLRSGLHLCFWVSTHSLWPKAPQFNKWPRLERTEPPTALLLSHRIRRFLWCFFDSVLCARHDGTDWMQGNCVLVCMCVEESYRGSHAEADTTRARAHAHTRSRPSASSKVGFLNDPRGTVHLFVVLCHKRRRRKKKNTEKHGTWRNKKEHALKTETHFYAYCMLFTSIWSCYLCWRL